MKFYIAWLVNTTLFFQFYWRIGLYIRGWWRSQPWHGDGPYISWDKRQLPTVVPSIGTLRPTANRHPRFGWQPGCPSPDPNLWNQTLREWNVTLLWVKKSNFQKQILGLVLLFTTWGNSHSRSSQFETTHKTGSVGHNPNNIYILTTKLLFS